MNPELFNEVCDKILNTQVNGSSKIGTLGEKTIHAIIKNYLDPSQAFHEIKVKNFYADIFNERGITEIQTRSFDRLRRKLEVFLEMKPVTIVYPIPYIKYIRWVNKETGEISAPRKSTKTGSPYLIFRELYKIKNHLLHPNLRLHIILIDMEEYRLLDGWSKDKKKGATKCDRIPTKLVDEIYINELKDYYKLLPQHLTNDFTVKDYKKVTGIGQRDASYALNILNYLGIVHRTGKKSQAYLYSR